MKGQEWILAYFFEETPRHVLVWTTEIYDKSQCSWPKLKVNTCPNVMSIKYLPTFTNFLKPFLVLLNNLGITDGLESAVVQDTICHKEVWILTVETTEGERKAPKNKIHGFSVDPCRSKLQVINKVTINLTKFLKGATKCFLTGHNFLCTWKEIQRTLVWSIWL